MLNKKRMLDKERILRFLIRKGSLQNTYKVTRELDMNRTEVLEILNELAKEGNVRLRSGSVLAITKELTEEEKVKTKSEVEELKERIEKLETRIDLSFSRLREAIPMPRKILSKNKSKEDNPLNPEEIRV